MDGELAEISVWQLSTDGSAHLGAVLPVTERGVSLHDNSLRSVSGGAHRRAQTQSIRPETLAFLRQLDIPFVAAKSSSHAPSTRGGNSEEELEVNLNAALELLLHIIDAAKSLEDINATIPDQFEFLSGGLFRFCTEAFDAASLKLLEYLFTATADAEAGAQDLFDIVIDRIFTSRPESISSLFPDSVNNGQLTSLLHLSVARPNVREPMVLSILEKCPKLAHTVDEEGTVPLHRAAGNPACPIEVIRLLLKADPDAARRIDGEGYLPLHWAVNAEQCRPEVIKFLINACPDTCAVACNQGTIPLHWAVDRPDPSMDVVYALAKAFPKGLKRRCNAGNIPVHRCVDRSDISMECLEWLVSKYPKSLEMANNDGQLPLHRLVDRSDVDLTALSFLIEVYPGALSTPDLEGYLSIHIALDTDSPHVAAVLELVRKRPETAAMKTSDGMLPFHYALNAEEPSIELIQALLEAYPVAASRYAVDIIPEDENADPLNWTGNWKKNKWMPLDRARERGLSDIVEAITSTLEKIGPANQTHPHENRRSVGKDYAAGGSHSIRNEDMTRYTNGSASPTSNSSLPPLVQPKPKLSDNFNSGSHQHLFDDGTDRGPGTLPAIEKTSDFASPVSFKSNKDQLSKATSAAIVPAQLYFEDDREFRHSHDSPSHKPIIRYKRRDHGHSRGRTHQKEKRHESSDPHSHAGGALEDKDRFLSSDPRARSASRRKRGERSNRTREDRSRNIKRQVRELEALKASLDERASSLLELENQLRASLESIRVGSPAAADRLTVHCATDAATVAAAADTAANTTAITPTTIIRANTTANPTNASAVDTTANPTNIGPVDTTAITPSSITPADTTANPTNASAVDTTANPTNIGPVDTTAITPTSITPADTTANPTNASAVDTTANPTYIAPADTTAITPSSITPADATANPTNSPAVDTTVAGLASYPISAQNSNITGADNFSSAPNTTDNTTSALGNADTAAATSATALAAVTERDDPGTTLDDHDPMMIGGEPALSDDIKSAIDPV